MKKTISAKNMLSFCNRLITLICCIDNAGISGKLYSFSNNELLLVLDESPVFTDRGIGSALGTGLLRDLNDDLINKAKTEEQISNISELIFRCFIENVKPDLSWTKEIIFCFNKNDDMAHAVEMLLFHNCFSISGAVLDKSDYKYLLKVHNLPVYVALYCKDKMDCRVFYRALGNYFCLWGIWYPLLREELLPDIGENITLLCRNGNHINIKNTFEDIYNLVIPEFCGKKADIKENCEELKIQINLELSSADEVQNHILPKEDLWLIPKDYINQFSRDIYKPESYLNELQGYYLTLKDRAYLLLWYCSLIENRDLSLSSLVSPSVKAFYRVPYINKRLYIPKGYIFKPRLKSETIEDLFGLSNDHFTLIIPEGDKGFFYVHFPGKCFKSVRKAFIDYIVNVKRVDVILNNDVLYDFGEPMVYNKTNKEHQTGNIEKDIKKSPDKSAKSPGTEKRGGFKLTNLLDKISRSKPEGKKDIVDDKGLSSGKIGKLSIETGCIKKDLLNTASGMLDRYSDLTPQDWRDYYDVAKHLEYYYKRDKIIAMTNILFTQNSNIEFILSCFGLSSTDFLKKDPNIILGEIFQNEWRKKEKEEILFKLYALAKIHPDMELEHKYQGNLNELSEDIYSANNLKLLWMLARIHKSIVKDEAIIIESKNKLQALMGMLDNPHIIGTLLPEAIRIAITNRFLAENEKALEELIRSFPEPVRSWSILLKFFYLEIHPVFAPSEIDLKSIKDKFRDEEQKKFYDFLHDAISICKKSHKLYYEKHDSICCDIKNHSPVPAFVSECIKEEEQYHNTLSSLLEDTNSVRKYLNELKLTKSKSSFFLCLSRCILFLRQSDNNNIDLVKKKIENLHDAEKIKSPLYRLIENRIDENYAHDQLLKIDPLSKNNQNIELIIFWLNLMDILKIRINHDKVKDLYNKLFMNDMTKIDNNCLRILYSILKLHLGYLEDEWGEIYNILDFERKIIRENVNKDINKEG